MTSELTYVGVFCFIFKETCDLVVRPVESADYIAMIIHVQNEILTHDRQSDDGNVSPVNDRNR